MISASGDYDLTGNVYVFRSFRPDVDVKPQIRRKRRGGIGLIRLSIALNGNIATTAQGEVFTFLLSSGTPSSFGIPALNGLLGLISATMVAFVLA